MAAQRDLSKVSLELCVGSLSEAIEAQAAGADRVELCAGLPEGGTTPSVGAIHVARERLEIDLFVMIRPRAGDFVYSEAELAAMVEDIHAAKRAGADGVVTGALTTDGAVDAAALARLCRAAAPLPVTFHRAFDVASDPLAALRALARAGVARVLTSAQRADVLDGLDRLAELVQAARESPRVLAACGAASPVEVARVVQASGVSEVHVYAPELRAGPMSYPNPGIPMGTPHTPSEDDRVGVAADRVREARRLLDDLR